MIEVKEDFWYDLVDFILYSMSVTDLAIVHGMKWGKKSARRAMVTKMWVHKLAVEEEVQGKSFVQLTDQQRCLLRPPPK